MSARAAAQPIVARWTGADVSVAEIETQLARLRAPTREQDGTSHQRTSVMTHVAWVPPRWLDAAERVLEGMAARHPSRTVILVPRHDVADGLDALLSVRCFPVGDREICGEVIELHLRGTRTEAPASIVVPLAIADLPVFLRWRGEPAFEAPAFVQLVDLADRLIVDSSEWDRLRYGELVALLEHTAVSDLAWARLLGMRRALAACWPQIAAAAITVAGPPASAALLRGWLAARLGRSLEPAEAADDLEVRIDGAVVAPALQPDVSPSDLLSAELDHVGRDRVYEESLRRAARDLSGG